MKDLNYNVLRLVANSPQKTFQKPSRIYECVYILCWVIALNVTDNHFILLYVLEQSEGAILVCSKINFYTVGDLSAFLVQHYQLIRP
jgi:hypothetical protein